MTECADSIFLFNVSGTGVSELELILLVIFWYSEEINKDEGNGNGVVEVVGTVEIVVVNNLLVEDELQNEEVEVDEEKEEESERCVKGEIEKGISNELTDEKGLQDIVVCELLINEIKVLLLVFFDFVVVLLFVDEGHNGEYKSLKIGDFIFLLEFSWIDDKDNE